MRKVFLMSMLLAMPVAASADALDQLVASMGTGSADNMALAGVMGKTLDALKDPRSMQIIDAYTKREGATATGCLAYRAKNSFGGYGQPGHAVWQLKAGGKKPTLLFNGDSAAQWNRHCSGKGFKDQKALAQQVLDHQRGSL